MDPNNKKQLELVRQVAFISGRLDAPFAIKSRVLEEAALSESAFREARSQVENLLRASAEPIQLTYHSAFARGRSGAASPVDNAHREEPRGAKFLSAPLEFRDEAAKVSLVVEGNAPPMLRDSRPLAPARPPSHMPAPLPLPIPAPPAAARQSSMRPQDLRNLVGGTTDLPEGFAPPTQATPFEPSQRSNPSLFASASTPASADPLGDTAIGADRTESTLPFLKVSTLGMDDERRAPTAGREPLHEPPSSSGASALTLEQYASLCAERVTRKGDPGVLHRYGIASAREAALVDAAWRTRFSEDERLRRAWAVRRDQFIAWLKRSP